MSYRCGARRSNKRRGPVEDAVFLASGNGFERLGVPLTVEHEPLMVAKK